jgi:hypothetical protein
MSKAILDEISGEPSPSYIEFSLAGQTMRLDAVGEDEKLFFVFRDMTAADTTYRPGRFLYIEKMPNRVILVTVDFNKAYNPPCAFNDFTTCPLLPEIEPAQGADTSFRIGDRYAYHRLDRLTGITKEAATAITDSQVIFDDGKIILDMLGNTIKTLGVRRFTPRQELPREYTVGKNGPRATALHAATGRWASWLWTSK